MLDLVALFLWAFTAAAGVYLLVSGKPRRDSPGPPDVPETVRSPAAAGTPGTVGVPAAAAAAAVAGKRPTVSHTRISTGPGEHPLLEFTHPALGLIGLGCWVAYVATRFAGFAWVAFAVIVAAALAGLTWAVSTTRAARRRSGDHRPPFPPRLLAVHGSAAALTLVLAVLTALTAARA